MKKLMIIMVLMACVSCRQQVRPDNGHDYDYEVMQPNNSRHSVDCRKCKAIRRAEIKAYVDSALSARLEAMQ